MTMDALMSKLGSAFGLSSDSAQLSMVMHDGRRCILPDVKSIEPGRDLEVSLSPSTPSAGGGGGGGVGGAGISDLRSIPFAHLRILKELASGAFGTVSLCTDTVTGYQVAVKTMRGGGREASIRREIQNLRSVPNSPALVQVMGICEDHPHGIAIVLEYCKHGSLRAYLNVEKREKKKLPWRFALGILKQTAGGIAFLHSLTPPVIHRDIRCANILLSSVDPKDPVAKVTDFGLSHTMSTVASSLSAGAVSGTVTTKGPIGWMAPETLRLMEGDETKQVVSQKTDVYMFGTVIFELLTGEEPYPTSSAIHIRDQRRANPTMTPLTEWRKRHRVAVDENSHWNIDFPSEEAVKKLIDVMELCWEPDARRRPMMLEVAEDLKVAEQFDSYL